jgi:hypothetical protein
MTEDIIDMQNDLEPYDSDDSDNDEWNLKKFQLYIFFVFFVEKAVWGTDF